MSVGKEGSVGIGQQKRKLAEKKKKKKKKNTLVEDKLA